MASTFFGLNIGVSGLYTYQAGLNTTAHNAANAETVGFSRQVIEQKAGIPIQMKSSYGMVGTGVMATSITQVRDEYYDLKYRNNSTVQGNYETKAHYMKEIETYFNEINIEGFSTSFNKYFDSLQELSKDPSSLTVRTQVTNFATSLTEYFNSLSNSMTSIQEEANFEVKNQVDRVNSLAKQIAIATKQINNLEVNGGTANDLRDERALLVDELSEIANISVAEHIVGNNVGVTTYNVKLNGQTLVDGYEYNTLQTVPREEKINQNDIDGLYEIYWNSGQKFDTTSSLLSGSLKAVFEVRDGNNMEHLKGTVSAMDNTNTKLTISNPSISTVERMNMPEKGSIVIGNKEVNYKSFIFDENTKSYVFTLENPLTENLVGQSVRIGEAIDYKGIPYYMGQLNEFVRTFSKSVNNIHNQGQDLEGQDGLDFFNGTNITDGKNFSFLKGDSYQKLTAGNFTVTKDIVKDPSKLAISDNVVNGVENKEILDKLLSLKNDSGMFKQGAPASFLQTLVAEIGIDTKKSETFSESQKDILYMIQNQRLSVSGVDMDEEAMNLVKFQNAYNLSAKVIQVMNEIYDKLINGTGA